LWALTRFYSSLAVKDGIIEETQKGINLKLRVLSGIRRLRCNLHLLWASGAYAKILLSCV
ncbi:hypothetical protein, partial [Eisenbergiella porci]